ncbi:MAG: ABC transporter substrate binding protein, partial [Clostridia bacterium]
GGVASLGAKYYDLGKQTAQMAFDILYNGKKTTEIVMQKPKDLMYVINETVANEIGFTIPQVVKDLVAAQNAAVK